MKDSVIWHMQQIDQDFKEFLAKLTTHVALSSSHQRSVTWTHHTGCPVSQCLFVICVVTYSAHAHFLHSSYSIFVNSHAHSNSQQLGNICYISFFPSILLFPSTSLLSSLFLFFFILFHKSLSDRNNNS